MKLLALSILLSAVPAVSARDPACHPPAASCRFVSPWTARECFSIIKSRHIKPSTCEAPEGTVTKTTTVTLHPTFTQTKTVKPATSTKTSTKIVTVTDPVTRQDTTTAWTTVIAVSTATTVDSEFSTATTTTTSVETDYATTAFITTQDSTSTVSWAPETCSQAPFKRSEKYHEDELPRDCSCFLTSTKSCGPRVTKVITRTKEDYPKIVTKTVTDRNCKTVTTTKTSTTHVNGAPPPKKTVTSTTTSTTTTTATSTSTVEETTTATVATTTTLVESVTITTTGSVVIQTEDPCSTANLNKYLLNGLPSNPNVVLGFRGDGFNDPSNCCSNCHQNSGCVFWELSADGSICSGYFTNRNAPVQGCASNSCPMGHPVMDVSAPDGNTYGMGQCGQFVFVE